MAKGYKRGVSLRAAPYDFRYAPHSQPFYFVQLRKLVEETSALNANRKVVLVAHSMGGLWAAYFLSRQPAAWKDRYIKALITANTPWAGQSRFYTAAIKACPHWQQIVAVFGNNFLPKMATKLPVWTGL